MVSKKVTAISPSEELRVLCGSSGWSVQDHPLVYLMNLIVHDPQLFRIGCPATEPSG